MKSNICQRFLQIKKAVALNRNFITYVHIVTNTTICTYVIKGLLSATAFLVLGYI